MNKSLAQCLLSQFGFNETVLSIEPIKGGRQHTIFKVSLLTGQTYVIKQLNHFCYLGNYTNEHFNETERLAAHVASYLKCSIAAYQKESLFVLEDNEMAYLIYPWCDGLSLFHLTHGQCQQMAALLFKLHQLPILKTSLKTNPTKPFANENWQTLLAPFLNQKKTNALMDIAKTCFNACKNNKTQSVLSHRDLNLDNILWLTDTQPILIDWESAGAIVPGVELLGLAFNLGGIASGQLDLSLVKTTINAYILMADNKNMITEAIYLQSYASWFYWLDYCLSKKNSLSKKEAYLEINTTLKALEFLERHKKEIINI